VTAGADTLASPLVRHHDDGCGACAWMASEINRLHSLLTRRADQANRLTLQRREIETLAADLQTARHEIERLRAELNRNYVERRAAA